MDFFYWKTNTMFITTDNICSIYHELVFYFRRNGVNAELSVTYGRVKYA